jgi:hypothetical protein
MEQWQPMEGPERVSMTKQEFESRIAEATERGYRNAQKSYSKPEGLKDVVISLAKAVLLLEQ